MNQPSPKRAIEEDFPIVEINRLVVPERNGFKPVYQMHKTFAPRASCVFRAILLAALKPAGANIIAEFYKDHTEDPDTKGKTVLDPFMGGGTTVIEAVRLGAKPVGIELNPVPWFVVKVALTAATPSQLDEAFQRLEGRTVAWSGKPLGETLAQLYRTQPPFYSDSGASPQTPPSAHAIHTFWVKSAICTTPTCKKPVPLFSDYTVANKAPSIRYHQDCTCPNCDRKFDWEIEPAALVADPRLMLHSSTYSAGTGRTTTRWSYAHPDGGLFVSQGEASGGQAACLWGTVPKGHVHCPHCHEPVKPQLAFRKPKRKKIPITALHCPQTEEVFQWRGPLDKETQVTSPSGHLFNPLKANVPEDGGFLCPHCGNPQSVIASIRTLPPDLRLPLHVYALQTYCSAADCREEEEGSEEDMFSEETATTPSPRLPKTTNLIWKNKGRFFARFTPRDLASYQSTTGLWGLHMAGLPWPRSEIPNGQETKRLHEDHVHFFHQMFNERQLLALSTLLQAITQEEDQDHRALLLLAFSGAVERNNLFCRYFNDRNTVQGNFDRHDYARKIDPAENAVWGLPEIRGTFQNMLGRVREGLAFRTAVYDRDLDRLGEPDSLIYSAETIALGQTQLLNGDSRELVPTIAGPVDAVVTDPPYAGNVNYSELYDFFYVWLRLALKDQFEAFKPEYTPKIPEIIENKSRGLSNEDFREGLKTVFQRSLAQLKDDGLLAFTYHHSGNQQWVDLCDAVCLAGFVIEAVYPVHAEKESSLNLQNNEGIAYDLIHVCRKRPQGQVQTPRSWAGLRQVIRQRARDEIARVETGRYGSRALSPADVRIVLIGKCLEIYSRHYGSVLNHSGHPLPMHDALLDIGEMVEQMISKESPLPAELENADTITRIWLRALCAVREVTVDSIRKLTQGLVELNDLTSYRPPLVRKGRLKGGRTYEVLTPLERLDGLQKNLRANEHSAQQLNLLDPADNTPVVFGPAIVDILHLLLAHAELGERLDNLVERYRGQREPLRAALEFLKQRDPNRWAKACDKLLPFYSDLFAQSQTPASPPTK